jgi:hypothetical protein
MRHNQNPEAKLFIQKALNYNEDACLIWPFSLNRDGYAQIHIRTNNEKVSRIICEHFHGQPPTNKHDAAHLCNIRACINGKHLEWKTRKENIADELIFETRNRGEKHGLSKLTQEQVIEIKKLLRNHTMASIARRFKVDPGTIQAIKKKRSWFWVKDPELPTDLFQ